MNMTKEPFNDVRIRKAVLLAIDPVQLNQVSTDGLGEPITAWFVKSGPFYDAVGEFPKSNAAEAQKLIDAWSAEKGKSAKNYDMIPMGFFGVHPEPQWYEL